jgi:hypothetical protein
MGFVSVLTRSMLDEFVKIAAWSSPSIVAPPTPGGDGGQLSATPAKPITPRKLVGKVVTKTNLQKTNYTKPNTDVVTPNVSLTSEQGAVPPPVVRS